MIGHHELRARLTAAVARGTLPASLMMFGPAGTGKERLALWLATRLLCETPTSEGAACGSCRHCTYAAQGAHPDLHWYFPRPRLKDGAADDMDDVLADLADAIAERVKEKGPWTAADPTDGLYVTTVRAMVRRAVLTPAIARRKVIVVADADRMVSQEGKDEAANAFLKLLEEPPANTTIILTSNLSASLLPTIRSRVAAVRVAPLSSDARAALEAQGVKRSDGKRTDRAAAMLDAARGGAVQRYAAALSQGSWGARGAYSEALDALVGLLHERARDAASQGDDAAAAGAARGVALVEEARRAAYQNVNPQLLTARLLRDLAPLVS